MARTFSDDFNRSNENLQASADWDVDLLGNSQGLVLDSNHVWARGGAYANLGTVSSAAMSGPTDNQSSAGTIGQHGAIWGFGVRLSSAANKITGYGVEISTTKIDLLYYDDWAPNPAAGAPTRNLLGNWTNTISVSDVIKIIAIGTTISVKVNGTERISVTEASLSSGAPGVYGTSGGGGIPFFDDYVATDEFVPAGGGTPFSIGVDGSWNRNMGHP